MIAIPNEESKSLHVQIYYLPYSIENGRCKADFGNRKLLEQATVANVELVNAKLKHYLKDCPSQHVMFISLEGPEAKYWIEGIEDGTYS